MGLCVVEVWRSEEMGSVGEAEGGMERWEGSGR